MFNPMVASKKYPLEPLRRLRGDEVDAKSRELAEAAQGRAMAEEGRQRREQAHAELLARTEAVAVKERALLEGGELSARDLIWEASWREGAEARKAESAEDLAAAVELERNAREEEARRLAALAAKKAEAEAVERDRERWERERARLAQAKEDEAAEEGHAARLHRSREGMKR